MAFMLAPSLLRTQTKRKPQGKAMDTEDLQPRKKLPDLVLGEDISALSAHELELRIARLEEEIARCTAAIKARHATKSAAESFFKK
jgi:uncharacterized small protein (DUF1192 family)